MATLPIVNRVRIMLDLVQDGEVAALANYASVDQASAALSLEYANYFYSFNGPQMYEEDGTTPRLPTNDELAAHYLNEIRRFHQDKKRAARLRDVAATARDTEIPIVDAEIATELGAIE